MIGCVAVRAQLLANRGEWYGRMPTLLDAANAFSKLGKRSVGVREVACVRVRNRHATCDLCLRVCSHEAISIENNELVVDNALCTGCGACTSVCPTQALELLDDADALVMAAVDEAEGSETVAIACEHARNVQAALQARDDGASSELAQPWGETALAVPCLAAIDEAALVHAACAGVALQYFSADCAQCPNANGALIEDILAQAQKLIAGFASCAGRPGDLCVSWQLVGESEAERPARSRDTSPEMTRRGMFDQLVARTTDSVAEAAVHTFYVSQARPEEKPTLGQTLRGPVGALKSVSVERNALVLDDLYRVAEKAEVAENELSTDAFIPTRLFGEVEVDTEACDLCGICMTFCPTKALSGVAREPVNPFVAATREVAISGELTFRANDCVNCRLCVDVCPRGALELRAGIEQRDLFALDPRELLVR